MKCKECNIFTPIDSIIFISMKSIPTIKNSIKTRKYISYISLKVFSEIKLICITHGCLYVYMRARDCINAPHRLDRRYVTKSRKWR